MLGFRRYHRPKLRGRRRPCWSERACWSRGHPVESAARLLFAAAEAGADLAITYRKNQEGAEATARELRAKGRRAEVLRVDISQEEEIRHLVEHLQRTFSRIDVWINNAGADILTGDAGRHSPPQKLDTGDGGGRQGYGAGVLGGR